MAPDPLHAQREPLLGNDQIVDPVKAEKAAPDEPAEDKSSSPPESPSIVEAAKIGAVAIRMKKVLPDWLQSVNMQHVKLGYHYLITHGSMVLLIPLIVYAASLAAKLTPVDWHHIAEHIQANYVQALTCSAVLVFVATYYFATRKRPIYLVDFACYMGEEGNKGQGCKAPLELFVKHSEASGFFDAKSMEFQKKILLRSGLGEETYLPKGVCTIPPNPSMRNARLEAEEVMFSALEEMFAKTGVKPKDVGILVVNCSLFCPTPSLSAMIINKFGLRSNIKSYNLGGMGCSAGVIAADLAADMLQVYRGETYAVVVSTENITQNWYFGNKRSMLIPNCLFRMGGAAVLMSNKRKDWWRSKYQLVHTVRTHLGSSEKCFRCVVQEEDMDGNVGVVLSKDLMAIAGQALKTNITTLGPLVLPLSEQLIFFAVLVARKLGMKMKPYIPDFKLAFEHFCIHAGGRAVLDEIEKNLQLKPEHLEPSRMTLYRFGNTSSSSIWYELAYSEAKNRIRRGDRVWQIAFGSGFKCNSAVWRALRRVRVPPGFGPWRDCIHRMPVELKFVDEGH